MSAPTDTTTTDISPLRLIESAVTQRGEQLRLDPDHPHDRDRLLRLIDDEIAAWDTEHRRGRRPLALADPEGVTDRIRRNLLGYGPLQPLLDDPDVWEIMINSPTDIFVKRHNGLNGYHHEVFHDDDHVERIITRLLDHNTTAHRALDPTHGLQDAQLADGSRVHIAHRDLTRGGHLVVNIRKFTGNTDRRLDDLINGGTLTYQAASFLRTAIAGRANIVVTGSPGAGKTTLLSCLLAELDPALRVVVAEEVFEAQVPLPNVAGLQTRAARGERSAIDLRQLVAGFLRMAPDVAVVGEVRDREALPLLLTLSSGVTGYTTLHAATARQALTRLRFVCQLADTELPLSALNALVSDTIDVIVHLRREGGQVRVDEIVAVEDQASGADSAQFTVTDLFVLDQHGELRPTGLTPSRLQDRMNRVAAARRVSS